MHKIFVILCTEKRVIYAQWKSIKYVKLNDIDWYQHNGNLKDWNTFSIYWKYVIIEDMLSMSNECEKYWDMIMYEIVWHIAYALGWDILWRFYRILYVIGDCIALFDICQFFCIIDYSVVLPHRAMLIMFWSLADGFWRTHGV